MRLIQQFLICYILCFCLQLALCRNKPGSTETENLENNHSLLDTDEAEDDIETTTSTAKPSPEPNQTISSDSAETRNKSESSAKKPKKKKSRKITLPADYNKLEIPRPSMKSFFRNLLGEDFDQLGDAADELEGDFDFGPLLVGIDVKVRSIRDIDEIQEEITVELDFIAQWIDAVILFDNEDNDADAIITEKNYTAGLKSLDPVFLKSIWKPDIFIENVISISRPELIAKPIRLLFSPHGYFVFSTRVTVKMDCEMEFHYYPADTQCCIFKLRSYSYTNKDVNITWDEDGGPFLLDLNEHNFDVKLDKMETLQAVEAEGLIDDDYKETYTILQFKISARRKLSYHLIQTYLPSTFFIIITWLSFLVPATMVEARIGISMTTLLTLTSMFSSVRENTPIVSYVKAIDLWMVACIFFVFLTLLEFTLLTWRRHLKPKLLFPHEDEPSEINCKEKEHQYDPVKTTDKTENNIELDDLGPDPENLTTIDLWLKRFKEKDIEKYGFRAFSLLFMIFNLAYWPWILVSSDYFNWHVDLAYNAAED